MAQELNVVWLVARSATDVGVRRFCRRCAPSASAEDVACAICADGPVLAQDVIVVAGEEAVVSWLNMQGWRSSADRCGLRVLLCPRCARFAGLP
jgi:hypothetical protein